MSAIVHCAKCGAPLATGRLGERCPACVLRLALEAGAPWDDRAENPAELASTLDLGRVRSSGDYELLDEIAHGGKGAGMGAAELPVEGIGQTIGPYKLLEKVGEGGCGAVYVAEQTHPVRRRIALKVVKLGMDTHSVVARFEAERQALAMMDHPNIAKVLDAGSTAHGRPYFVMELVRGIKITDYCDQNHLPTQDRLDLFIKVCQAIQHAHQKGIIHRDIKPSNILVTLHDGVPVPKVIDFGIAKATEGRLTDATVYTQLHQFIGTPAYMSPEQAEMSGLDVDTRSDIYSLGVLLYELLVGQTPFDAAELMSQGIDTMRKTIREKDPERPSTRLATLKGEELTATARRRSVETGKLANLLKGDLDWIVMKCLEKDRTRRYETANGLAMDIRRHMNWEPVIARPPNKLYEFRKAVRRHKAGVIATAAVIVVLAVGVTVAGWQAMRATRAKKDAVAARLDAEFKRAEADNARKAETEQKLHARRLLYAADMNLAQQATESDNLGRARRILDRHRPAPGEEDLRGWEWRYLWQQCRSAALAVLTKRPARGLSVSFSPDGTFLAAGYLDGRIELWGVSRRALLKVIRPAGAPAHVAFSPRTNLLATTADRGVITLLDVAGGPESTLWEDPRYLIRDLCFSADGTRLLAFIYGSGSPASVVFDVARRMALSTNDTVGATTHMGIARLSSDNRRLYLSQVDRQAGKTAIRCLDAETRQEIWNSEIDSDYGVSALALSPDDRFLVTGTGYEQTTVFVCDAHTGKLLTKLAGHTGWIGELVFSRDGRLLASAAADQSLRVWDTSSWTEITVFRGHGDEVHTVAFSPDGKLLASSGKDGAILLWDLATPQSARGYHPLPQDVQYAAEVSPGTVLVMDFEFRPAILRLDDLRSAPVQLPAWFAPRMPARYAPPDLVGFYDQTNWLRICEIRNEFPRVIAELSAGGKVVRYPETGAAALAYCPGQRLLAWGERPATVHILRLDPPARRVQISSALTSPAPVVFSPGGKHLVLIGDDRQGLEVRDVNTGKLLLSADKLLLNAVPFRYDHGLLFANEGRRLAAVRSVPGSREVVFWDLTQPGKPPTTFRERGNLVSLGVSPDGQTVSVCSEDGDLVLYDAQTVERKTVLHGHLQGVHGGSFSPDGKSVVSGSGGREAVKLWHAETGQELLTLRGKGSMLRVWFVDRGNAILSGGPARGSWQLWRAPSWQEIAEAEAGETFATQ